MSTTSRRTSKVELERIKSIQAQLEQRGIKLSQSEIGELMSEYLLKHYDDFVKLVEKRMTADREDEALQRLLFEPVDIDGEETDSVRDHDVIY